MAMVSVDDSSQQYRWTHSPSCLTWFEGWQLIGAVLHSSGELCDLSQGLFHHDSTINTVKLR